MQEIHALGFYQPYILPWKFELSPFVCNCLFHDGFLPNSLFSLSWPR